MNRTLFAGTLAALAILAVTPLQTANAQDGDNYVTGRIGRVTDAGADIYGTQFQFNGDTFGVGVGRDLGPLRVELNYDRQSFDLFGGIATADAQVLSATVFADFRVSDRLSLFAGAGVDYAQADLNALGLYSVDGNAFGWNAAAGGQYHFGPNAAVELRVSRLDLGELEFNGLTTPLVTWATTVGPVWAF